MLEDADARVIYRGSRHTVSRVRQPDGSTVIVKTPLPTAQGNAANARLLEREYQLLRTLNIPGITQVVALEERSGLPALVLADAGHQDLAQWQRRRPVPLPLFFKLALDLAGTLARLHQRGIVHRDVVPANVVVSADERLTLVDFDASSALEASAGLAPRREGSLRYLPPEETGRMDRLVDHRADLYGLGAILYELLTGTPLFSAVDPVDLVHAQLARAPVPPERINPRVPSALSAIVLRLLAKMPEARYANVEQLLRDLRAVRAASEATAGSSAEASGWSGRPTAAVTPATVHGRQVELGLLLSAWGRAVGGEPVTVDMVGEPGIGKSTLARQLYPSVAERNGHFVQAKFAMREGQAPYSALLEALRELGRDLQQSDPERATWGQRIADELREDLGALLQVLPEWQPLFHTERRRPPPPRSERGVVPAFVGLIKALAGPGHPLLLCLDDIQWADGESRRVMEALLANPIPHLLLLCTRRPSGSTPAGLDRPGGEQLALSPLNVEAVTALTADLLSCERQRATGLAELLWRKTGGNPLLCRKLLATLQSTRLVEYDTERQGWTWELAKIAAVEVTDGVADLMVRTLGRLPPATREALSFLACLGHQAPLSTLAAARKEAPAQTAAALEPAVYEGHLLQLWRAPRGGAPQQQVFQFAHDRILEAAYSLLPEAERERLHRVLGLQLLQEAGEDGIDAGDTIFAIVDQLNRGPCAAEQKLQLARLNLMAARRARRSLAFTAELAYLNRALTLLPTDGWSQHHELSMAIHSEAMQCAVFTGQTALGERLFREALAHAPTRLEKATLHERRVVAATDHEDYAQAAAIGVEAMELFGLSLPSQHGSELDELIRDNERALAGRSVEAVLEGPRLTDPEQLCCLQLLARLQIAFFLTRNDVWAWLLARIVNLCLRQGTAPASCQALVSYGILLLRRGELAGTCYRWGRLGVALSVMFDDPVEECRALAVFATTLAGYSQPFGQLFPSLRRVQRLGMDHGDTLFGTSAAVTTVLLLYHLGRPLAEVLAELETALALCRKANMQLAIDNMMSLRKVIYCLQNDERAEQPWPDERESLPARGPHMVMRIGAAYLLGDLEKARRLTVQARELAPSFTRITQPVELNFYGSLVFARCCQREGLELEERKQLLATVEANQKELAAWSASCPENFRHKHLLVAAELAAVAGRMLEAAELYEQAVEAAGRAGFQQDEALAADLAARFHRAQGRKRFAAHYLELALQGYTRWGAEARVRALESELMDLRADALWTSTSVTSGRAPLASTGDEVDLMSLARASEAIAGEIVPERLSAKLMEISLAVGGAERGALLIMEGGELQLFASGAVSTVPDVRRRPLDDTAELPLAVIEGVHRTSEPLVVGDATLDPQVSGDKWLSGRGVRSLLALPILHQGRLGGVLYLEHASATRAFTPQRVRLLQLLSGQIAIALENSQLFARLATEVEERRRAEGSVRFLADAGALMAESLDYQVTLNKVVQLAVPQLADWCVVDLLDERGHMRRMAAAHRDPQLTERLHEVRTDGKSWASPALSHEVLEAGKPVLIPELTDAALERYVSDPRTRDLVRALGVRSGMAVPLMAHGRQLGAMSFSSDRPGRRYGENDLVMAEELARRAALAIENARLYSEAREAVRRREEFLAVASHELNTPLTSLRLLIDSLQTSQFQEAPEEVGKALAILGRQSRRLSTLVHDLLDEAQLQSGRLAAVKLEDGDLAALVRQSVETFQPDLLRQGCPLEVQAAEVIAGRWDRGRVEQILGNLLSNAAKFGAGKPIRVVVDRLTPERARLIIEDGGIGIPPDRLPHVFDRFERAVPATHYGGLGLGLYIVREVARALGGTVAVESAVGKGSRFVVELPVTTGGS